MAGAALADRTHTSDWVEGRRKDLDLPPRPPEAAIEPTGYGAANGGALLLGASLATDGQAVTGLRDAIVTLLTSKERRQ
jgi:hypothetical protein